MYAPLWLIIAPLIIITWNDPQLFHNLSCVFETTYFLFKSLFSPSYCIIWVKTKSWVWFCLINEFLLGNLLEMLSTAGELFWIAFDKIHASWSFRRKFLSQILNVICPNYGESFNISLWCFYFNLKVSYWGQVLRLLRLRKKKIG